MSNAKRDQNNVPTLLGVSNVDGVTPVVIYADPVTHRLLVDNASAGSNIISSGSGSPVSIPTAAGYIYVDTNSANIYMATGVSSSADWKLISLI